MSEIVVTDAAVEAGVEDAARNGWEISHNAMRAALEAVYRVGAPRPLLDREAVRSLFQGPNACGYWLENIMDDHEQEAATDAVMELARPMPTREQIADYLRETVQTLDKGEEWYLADGVLALINGGAR